MAKPIIKPLPDLRRLDYHKSGIISKSGLWAFQQKLSGVKMMKAKESTLRFGQLLHEAIYEPALFVSSDEYIKAKATASATNEQMKLINHVERMASAARKDLILQAFLKHKDVQFEKAFWFTINGVPVQIKTDAVIPKFIHDAKSTACTTHDQFVQSCIEYGYFEQASLYKLGTGASNMYFLGISKTEPHKTFHIDCKKFKAEMKRAEANILGLLEMYCQVKPNYCKQALKLWKL